MPDFDPIHFATVSAHGALDQVSTYRAWNLDSIKEHRINVSDTLEDHRVHCAVAHELALQTYDAEILRLRS